MTITYTLDVSSAKFSCFARLLMRWRGSIWKSVYRELGSWLIVYSLLSALYRMLLNKQQKHVFEDVVAFCYVYSDFIPLTFMLGFYVSLVVSRWWEMFNCLGWIDNIALYVAAYLHGTDEWSKMARRSIVRHMVLLEAMTLRDISPVVRRRFPTEESLQAAGLITATEVKAMKEIVSPNGKFWTPVQWSMSVIRQARQRGNITSERAVKEIYDRLREYRTALGMLQCYDWVPIPLVYTQVVFLAVRSYFVIAVIGRQYVDGERHSVIRSPIDLYIPILSILQFVFFLGWMKVAEALVNPHGDDDDDFECNYLIDRNLQIGFSIVDGACNQELPLEKDAFWSDQVPEPLYSTGTAHLTLNPQIGSATDIPLPKEMEVFMVPRATGEYMEREPIETNPHRRLLGRRPSGHSNQSDGSRASTLSRFRSRFFNKPMFYGSARMQRDAKSGTLENGYFGNSTIPVASGTLSTASSSISILSDLIEQMSCVKESSPDGRDKLRALEGPKLSVIGERMELEAEESAQRKQSHIDEQLFEAKYSLGLGI